MLCHLSHFVLTSIAKLSKYKNKPTKLLIIFKAQKKKLKKNDIESQGWLIPENPLRLINLHLNLHLTVK